MALFAWTKSSWISSLAFDRTSLVLCGMFTTHRAITMLFIPPPMTTSSRMARSVEGKALKASQSLIMTMSAVLPVIQHRPRNRAREDEISDTSAPADRLIRPPHMTLANRSLPRLSVPKTCSVEGGRRRCERSMS